MSDNIVVLMLFGFGLLVILGFYYAATDNIREWQREKRRRVNGGEDYVSNAWCGRAIAEKRMMKK